jgi:hypothetical protein
MTWTVVTENNDNTFSSFTMQSSHDKERAWQEAKSQVADRRVTLIIKGDHRSIIVTPDMI